MRKIKLNINLFAGESTSKPSCFVKINEDVKIGDGETSLKDLDTLVKDSKDRVYLKVTKGSTSSQSFSAGVYQTIKFDNVISDTYNSFNKDTFAYTIPVSGFYMLSFQCEFTISSSCRTVLRYLKNGTIVGFHIAQITSATGSPLLNRIEYFYKGDVLTFEGKTDSVSSTLVAGDSTTFLEMIKL